MQFLWLLLFLIDLYRDASQSDSSIFERQKQNTKFFRSEEMAGVFSRFSLATDSEIEGLKNSSKMKSTRFWLSMWKKWCVKRK